MGLQASVGIRINQVFCQVLCIYSTNTPLWYSICVGEQSTKPLKLAEASLVVQNIYCGVLHSGIEQSVPLFITFNTYSGCLISCPLQNGRLM